MRLVRNRASAGSLVFPMVYDLAAKRRVGLRFNRKNLTSKYAGLRFNCNRHILRLVDVLPDKGHHFGRTIDAGLASIEDDLGYPRGCLNLNLQNVQLRGEKRTPLTAAP